MTKNKNKKVEKSSKAEPSSVSITMDELKTVKLCKREKKRGISKITQKQRWIFNVCTILYIERTF